jgi:hypothetical protein
MLRRTFALSFVILFVCSLFFALNVNSVSANTNQIYWGAWIGNSHIGNYNLLTSFESQVGKNVSIWNWIQLWNRPQDSENIPNFDTALMNQARSHGAIPMVSWGPENGWSNFPFTNLDSIIDGSQDAYLIKWGQDSAKWGHPYFVRLMWEFTGSWTDANGIYPWGNGNTPAKFVQAWQHVVDTVRAAGGTQISWVWCPGDVGDSVSKLHSVYPGDNYVDWVGTDIYGDLVHSSDIELTNIHSAVPNKPVMIPEIGWSGANKDSYWSNLLTTILPNQYPYVKAVVIWEMPPSLTVVDSATLSSFKQGISSNYYYSNVFGSIDKSPIAAIGESQNSTYNYPPVSSTSGTPLVISSLLGLIVAFVVIVMVAIAVVLFVNKTSKQGKVCRRL